MIPLILYNLPSDRCLKQQINGNENIFVIIILIKMPVLQVLVFETSFHVAVNIQERIKTPVSSIS